MIQFWCTSLAPNRQQAAKQHCSTVAAPWGWAAGRTLMRIERSSRETRANYLLKKLPVAYVLNRKSTLTTLLKLPLKFSLAPLSREDWGCFSLGFWSPRGLAQRRGAVACRGGLGAATEWLKEAQGSFECWEFHSTYSISTLLAF